MKRAKDVDEYIAQAPKEIQSRLQELRHAIKATIPEAVERMSYMMPYYHYKGRLVYFAYWTKHTGIYAITAPVSDQFKTELKGYVMSKGTIQFPHDKKLPLGLIKKLVKAQAQVNDEKVAKK